MVLGLTVWSQPQNVFHLLHLNNHDVEKLAAYFSVAEAGLPRWPVPDTPLVKKTEMWQKRKDVKELGTREERSIGYDLHPEQLDTAGFENLPVNCKPCNLSSRS